MGVVCTDEETNQHNVTSIYEIVSVCVWQTLLE